MGDPSKALSLQNYKCLSLGSGKVPDQLVNLILQHGVEAKTYEEVGGSDNAATS